MTNDNGLFDSVSENEILQKVKFRLGITDTPMNDAYILEVINDKLRDLVNFFTFTPKIAQLPIDLVNFVAPLPKGFLYLYGKSPVRTFTSNTTTPSVLTTPNAIADGFFKGTLSDHDFASVMDGYLRFGTGVTDNWCQISFIGANLDANGELKIPRAADRCLTYGAMADFCLERGDAAQSAKYQIYDLKYKKEKAIIKGRFAHSDPQDEKRTSDIMNHMNIRY